MTMLLALKISRPQLQSSKLTVCRNDECYPTRLEGLSSRPSTFMQWPMPVGMKGKPTMELIAKSLEGGDEGLNIFYNLNDDEASRDGDVYRVTLEGGDGRIITNIERTAKYQAFQPNGPDCGPPCHGVAFIEAGGDFENRPLIQK
ncbi:hypothetical protein OV208_00655 [Corallococcus sp. bb12-1]|uniref:hypothetical protein n=1 Tax=Corallococcus sp. bb12-1 TaxID=2996784 RepID=UPI002270DB65|nr:hypothetical protein [Corallococcus sp. bb12-1]MCY1039809.1 hypothetical protein [Corallococcus sp. bb12-1]